VNPYDNTFGSNPENEIHWSWWKIVLFDLGIILVISVAALLMRHALR